MSPEQIEAELSRIAALPPLERAAAAEALEAELRSALDAITSEQRPA
jgi:hypothetical protein